LPLKKSELSYRVFPFPRVPESSPTNIVGNYICQLGLKQITHKLPHLGFFGPSDWAFEFAIFPCFILEIRCFIFSFPGVRFKGAAAFLTAVGEI
jgi:hypothetical protein